MKKVAIIMGSDSDWPVVKSACTVLKEFGVPESDLDSLVEAGMQVQRLLVNNPRTVTPEDARALYMEIL